MKGMLSRAEVIELLPSEVINKLPINEIHKIELRSPIELLTADRFDVMADTIYAQCHLLGTAQNWSQRIYHDCKTIMGENQADHIDVNSISHSQKEFHDLLIRFKTGSIHKENNYFPVNQDDVIIDSAHQFAASLLFDQSITAIQFEHHPRPYDYQYFLEHGLKQDFADAMALTFSRLCPNMAVVVVFPIASGKDDQIHKILCEYGRIAYKKEVAFTKIGQYNLISLLYFNMHWIDPNGDINYAVRHHVDHRFLDNNLVKFIFVIFNDTSKNLEAKTRLRNLFDLKNFPVHINDTHNETIWIAEHILTPNSIYFLNHAQPWFSKKVLRNLQDFSQEIKRLGLNKDNFCLAGNAMLAAYGLRDAHKIDYLFFEDKDMNLPAGILCHDDELALEEQSIGDLIFDPSNHFYYRGLKFVAPHLFSKIIAMQNASKKNSDLRLLKSLENESMNMTNIWRHFRFKQKITLVNIFHIDIGRLKNLVPNFIRIPAGRIYRSVFGEDNE
jgi:hypothetical protein